MAPTQSLALFITKAIIDQVFLLNTTILRYYEQWDLKEKEPLNDRLIQTYQRSHLMAKLLNTTWWGG